MDALPAVFCVNGYGVPLDIMSDELSLRYLSRVVRIARRAPGPLRLYLAGGATDPMRPSVTEAAEMERAVRWLLDLNRVEPDRFLVKHIEGTDLLGNLEGLVRCEGREVRAVVFCEYARQDRVRILCRFLLPNARVEPVAFDSAMGRPFFARLRHLPGTVLAVGALLSPAFKRRVFDPLRRLHMARAAARRHARPSP